MESAVHSIAKTGFVDGDHYDTHRPTYTEEGVDFVANLIQENQQSTAEYDCVELGAGTGKMTKQIFSTLPENIKFLASEPSEGFLAKLRQQCPAVNTKQWTADSIPLPDCSIRNILAAQCFHWFANDKSMAEMQRVLVPGGKLILIWNQKIWSTPWIAETEKILSEFYDGCPRSMTYKWKEAIDSCEMFKISCEKIMDGIKFQDTVEKIVDHFGSMSMISRLTSDTKENTLQRIRSAIENHPDNKGLDVINIPFRTEIYVYQKV